MRKNQVILADHYVVCTFCFALEHAPDFESAKSIRDAHRRRHEGEAKIEVMTGGHFIERFRIQTYTLRALKK